MVLFDSSKICELIEQMRSTLLLLLSPLNWVSVLLVFWEVLSWCGLRILCAKMTLKVLVGTQSGDFYQIGVFLISTLLSQCPFSALSAVLFFWLLFHYSIFIFQKRSHFSFSYFSTQHKNDIKHSQNAGLVSRFFKRLLEIYHFPEHKIEPSHCFT